MVIALRSDHDVDRRRAADDLCAFRLRHAAGDHDPHFAPLARGLLLGEPQASQLRIDLLGGLFADVAGVEDHQIGVIGTGGLG